MRERQPQVSGDRHGKIRWEFITDRPLRKICCSSNQALAVGAECDALSPDADQWRSARDHHDRERHQHRS